MAKILDILRYPNPLLRRKCLPVTQFGEEIRSLAEDMLHTMYEANGIGLAAAQVGVLKRVVVIDLTHEPGDTRILVNPEILSADGSCQIEEGCLSVPGIYAKVDRAEQITLRYFTPEGKEKKMQCTGLLAICVQHEIDHLNGRLFVDYLSVIKRLQARMVARKYQAQQSTPASL